MSARKTWRWLGAIVGLTAILIILVVLFINSSIYNVAATYPDKASVAWGATSTDKEIWTIVAFTQKLPKMTSSEKK